MAIHNHESFPGPLENASIWRYIDFTQFVDLLESNALYFNRTDNFKDPYEGTTPIFNAKERAKFPSRSRDFADLDNLTNNLRKAIYVNCWHINEFESAAMWDLYNKSDGGIAIKSTFGDLKNCFIDDLSRMIIGSVRYIDYKNNYMPEGNVYSPVFHKRKSFEHERELRAMYEDPDFLSFADLAANNTPLGIQLKIDLNLLINKIYVSPDSPTWIVNLVSEVKNKYSINAEVIHSKLYEIE